MRSAGSGWAVLLLGCTDAVGLPAEQVTLQAVDSHVVDTGQHRCFDATREIDCPTAGSTFFGQDAQYDGAPPSYTVHGDGTVTDRSTNLMWTGSPDLNRDGRIDADDKLSHGEALAHAGDVRVGGHDDGRLPPIHELYSPMDFRGVDISGPPGAWSDTRHPFLDDDVFDFGYGDTSAGEREIDAQFATSTLYTSTTMDGNATMFGVNFADGRI
jgi:hypothetical protein